MALQSSAPHGFLFSGFWICRHSVGLRRGIGQSQGRYLHRPTQTQKGLVYTELYLLWGESTYLHFHSHLSLSLYLSVSLFNSFLWYWQQVAFPLTGSVRHVRTVCVSVCFAFMRECALMHGVQLWLATPPTRLGLTNCCGICARNWASGRVMRSELAKQ